MCMNTCSCRSVYVIAISTGCGICVPKFKNRWNNLGIHLKLIFGGNFIRLSYWIMIILQDYHLSRVFGSGLYLPLCPTPGFSALYTAVYGLLFSLLAIAILLIYIIRYLWTIMIIIDYCAQQSTWMFAVKCSARFSNRLSSRSSFDGIWLLSIITYKYTADTCFNLLRCQKVSGKGISGEFVQL